MELLKNLYLHNGMFNCSLSLGIMIAMWVLTITRCNLRGVENINLHDVEYIMMLALPFLIAFIDVLFSVLELDWK